MKSLWSLTSLILVFHAHAISQNRAMTYPVTPKEQISDNYFGTIVPDPYRWLEFDTSAQTKEWVTEQNDLSKKYLSKLQNRYPFRDQLRFNSDIDFGSLHKMGKFYVDFMIDENMIDETQKNLPFI